MTSRSHLVIPDTQIKPGVPMDHCRWIGRYAAERKPDVIVHLGDHWDMPSLSSYDRGKGAMEGRRYKDDIDAGNEAFDLIDAPLRTARPRGYRPLKRRLRGNHEWRVDRAVESDITLAGTIGARDQKSPGWKVVEFTEVVDIDGVWYSHYFYNPNTGRPYAGANIESRIKTIGHSFTMGHQQGMRFGIVDSLDGGHYGLVAGSCYLHDEQYLGPQGNSGWRGVVVCHEVAHGTYAPMFVTLEYLCQKYERVTLREFLRKRYPDLSGSLWR